MRAGALDRVIVIEQESITGHGGQGTPVIEWVLFAKVKASVKEISSNEAFIADQRQAFSRTIFKIHYQPGIKSIMRIIYQDAVYKIQGQPKELGRREGLEITATAEVE